MAEIQAGIRDALVDGNGAAVAPVLSGGARPEHRLAIHQRHYVASLTRALVERFPATVWLVGSALMTDAAMSFIREHPRRDRASLSTATRFPGISRHIPTLGLCPTWRSSPSSNGTWDAWLHPPATPHARTGSLLCRSRDRSIRAGSTDKTPSRIAPDTLLWYLCVLPEVHERFAHHTFNAGRGSDEPVLRAALQ